MDTKHLRIAISGPVGAGKTTLARDLGKKFKLPLLEENFHAIHQAKGNFARLQASKSPAESAIQDAFRNWVQSYFAWIRQRAFEQASLRGFIADRWEADLLSFWLRDFSEFNVDRATLELIQHMKAQGNNITLAIVLPPTSSIPEKNESGLLRTQSLCTRIVGSAMMFGLIRQYTSTPCLSISNSLSSVQDRIKLIEEFIRDNQLTDSIPDS